MLLKNKTIVSTAVNLPGPKACQQWHKLGAKVIKVEPPQGDPLQQYSKKWYQEINAGQQVMCIDFNEASGRNKFYELLKKADLFFTTSLLPSLEKFDLDWPSLHNQFPKLSMLQILGYADDEARPGHDLNFALANGLFNPPTLPRILSVDYLASERAVTRGLNLLFDASGTPHNEKIFLNEVAKELAAPLTFGATTSDGVLGGGYPGYGVYAAKDGWVALAALEPRFVKTVLKELRVNKLTHAALTDFFGTQSISYWSDWSSENKLPLSTYSANN